eukprot:3271531-Pyramimonas_sp.AAC.1
MTTQLLMLLSSAQILLLRPPVPLSSPPSSAEALLGGRTEGAPKCAWRRNRGPWCSICPLLA